MARTDFKSLIRQTVSSLALLLALPGAVVDAAHPEAVATAKSRADGKRAAANPLPPLSQRFADANTSEVPDFQKHVTPLLGRLGCNGRACHGSFQGRGGFALSLFGYDFKTDHMALMEEGTGRIDIDDPDESLVLAKPLDADMHEGGKRFDEGSWQHHVLRQWIKAGAKTDSGKPQVLEALSVTPNEIQFTSESDKTPLRVLAHWQDGSVEDVTELCRYQTNDDSIANVDDDGVVTAGMVGDTHVVAFYDNSVVPIPVLRPYGFDRRAAQTASDSSDHFIDQLVAEKLRKLAIEPSKTCSDSDFIRRASLDITGLLPSAGRARDFLSDRSPDKRERLVDELLDSPAYAAWWATRLSDWTGNSEPQMTNLLPVRDVAHKLWYEWLRTRIAENVAYDDIVEGIVVANSREPGEDYMTYCKNMSDYCREGGEEGFAERSSMPFYWGRRNFQKKEDRAIGFGYSFLGVRIECAQCHKHPFDSWSKSDFDQFANLFTPIRMNRGSVGRDAIKDREKMLESMKKDDSMKKLNVGMLLQRGGKLIAAGETAAFGELVVNARKVAKFKPNAKMNKKARKKALERAKRRVPQGIILGEEEGIVLDKDPREDLMAWLRDDGNPYFAKAIVNRVWANYFGIGIVNPSDDLNLANPPSNAPLLDELSRQFIENDFDLKWLHRTITNSQTYARSAEPNETNASDRSNFSRHIPHRLPAEVLHDCITLATASDKTSGVQRDDIKSLAIANAKAQRRGRKDFAMQVFGQSERESNCDCDRSDSPSLLQSVYLRNDVDVHRAISGRDGWVKQACEQIGEDGPTALAGSKRKIDSGRTLRGRLVKTAKSYTAMNRQQQKKNRKKIKTRYDNIAGRMNSLNFATPSFDELVKNPESWTTLTDRRGKVLDEVLAPTEPRGPSFFGDAAEPSLTDLIEDLYLRTLTRYPEPDELQTCIAFVDESKTVADGLSSLMWALVNTKEFILTH